MENKLYSLLYILREFRGRYYDISILNTIIIMQTNCTVCFEESS